MFSRQNVPEDPSPLEMKTVSIPGISILHGWLFSQSPPGTTRQLWQRGQLPLVTWHFLHLSLGEIGERGQTLTPQVTPGYSEHYNLCMSALSSSQFGYWLFLALKRSWRLVITLHFQSRWEQKSQEHRPLTPVPFILQEKQRDAAL